MIEAKVREYFEGACHHFLVPATEVPETVQLVFSMELLAIYSPSEARSEHKFFFGLPEDYQSVFYAVKITLGSVTTHPLLILP